MSENYTVVAKDTKPYRMILYKTTPEYASGLGSDVDLDTDLFTLPRRVKRDLLLKITKYQKKHKCSSTGYT